MILFIHFAYAVGHKVKICVIASENSLCCWSFKNLNDIIHTFRSCCWSYKKPNVFSLYGIIFYGFIKATRSTGHPAYSAKGTSMINSILLARMDSTAEGRKDEKDAQPRIALRPAWQWASE